MNPEIKTEALQNPFAEIGPFRPINVLRERLLELLLQNCFKVDLVTGITLASGIVSPYYIDCQVGFSNADFRWLAGELIYQSMLEVEIDAVGGMALAAVPFAIAISDAFYRHGKTVRLFTVTKKPEYGQPINYFSGDVREEDRVLVVDDVFTRGGSIKLAIQRCREIKVNVVQARTVVDRREGDLTNYWSPDVPYKSLVTLENLIRGKI